MAETDPRYWRRHAGRYDRVTLLLNRRFGEMAERVGESLRGARRRETTVARLVPRCLG